MKFMILHIGDIHIKNKSDAIFNRANDIAKCTYQYLRGIENVFIVVSGDVAFSGKEQQYEYAIDLLSDIKLKIMEESGCNVEYIIVPGNHDSDFSVSNEARNIIVGSIDDSNIVDDNVVASCVRVQKNFFSFREIMEEVEIEKEDYLWRSRQFSVGGKVVVFEELNVSWLSQKEEVQGKIYYPIKNYFEKANESFDLRIIVMHHPLNWYRQGGYRDFRSFLRSTADILITGHEHQGGVGEIDDAENGASIYIEGSALQGESGASGFIITLVDLDTNKYIATQYRWKKNRYELAEEGSWTTYRDLPKKFENPFSITTTFREKLDDPGAFIAAPSNKKIYLSDIFVYPDLKKMTGAEKTRAEYISSSVLLNPERTADGVLIQGEEKSGSTSLLYQLYSKYHEMKFVPVYLRGTDIKRADRDHVTSVILRAVTKQYGEEAVDDFKRLSRKSVAIFVDSLDQSPIASTKTRLELFTFFNEYAAHLVISVGEMFELKEMLEYESDTKRQPIDHYIIQPINYTLRSQIISKWFGCTQGDQCDEGSLIALCDKAERQIDAIMGKTLIPCLPLYLVTLLQSITLHSGNEFKETALGHYYSYLFTEALTKCGAKADELTELYQYTSHLAWEYHLSGREELTIDELDRFNSNFSTQWTNVNFESRLKLLLASRVLSEESGYYSFRYPYIYYFLKGYYISRNLSDQGMRDYVISCTKHLYVRDRANTVLFLAHHSNDDFLLNAIVSAYRSLFAKCEPVKLQDDSRAVSELIQIVQKLMYSGESPKEYRERANRLKDTYCAGDDGLAEKEETSSELSGFAQLVMLLKTTEILGQILKNQYATIMKSKKVELIHDVFSGPLRVLADFYQYFLNNPGVFYREVEALFFRKKSGRAQDEIDEIVRNIVSKIVQWLSYFFLYKGSHSVNSEKLHDEVDQTVAANPTTAFRFMRLITYLDSPRSIPRHLIEELLPHVEDDFLTRNLLHIAVLQRLYMFKTSEKDMQWLNSTLGLKMTDQHAIAYNSTRRRLLK